MLNKSAWIGLSGDYTMSYFLMPKIMNDMLNIVLNMSSLFDYCKKWIIRSLKVNFLVKYFFIFSGIIHKNRFTFSECIIYFLNGLKTKGIYQTTFEVCLYFTANQKMTNTLAYKLNIFIQNSCINKKWVYY